LRDNIDRDILIERDIDRERYIDREILIELHIKYKEYKEFYQLRIDTKNDSKYI
jgi:hypothetical protein